jgi:hypothetical protein
LECEKEEGGKRKVEGGKRRVERGRWKEECKKTDISLRGVGLLALIL